jgi:hypothetical protein
MRRSLSLKPFASPQGLTRRRVLQGLLAAAGTLSGSRILRGFPAIHAAEPVVLRIAGTGVNQHQQIADKARADLGLTIQYTSLISDDVVKRAATQPTSFDLLDSEYWMLKKSSPRAIYGVWTSGASVTMTTSCPFLPRASCPMAPRRPDRGRLRSKSATCPTHVQGGQTKLG